MNPEHPQNPREELEARVTALLLGELSAYETAAVQEAIAKDPELARLHDALKKTIGLVGETVHDQGETVSADPTPLKLSSERRQKLLAHFKTIAPKEFVRTKRLPKSRLLELAAVLAILGLLAALTIPNFVKSRSTSQSNAILNNLRQLDAAKRQWAIERRKSVGDVPSSDDLAPYFRRGDGGISIPVAGETNTVRLFAKAPETLAADRSVVTGGVLSANVVGYYNVNFQGTSTAGQPMPTKVAASPALSGHIVLPSNSDQLNETETITVGGRLAMGGAPGGSGGGGGSSAQGRALAYESTKAAEGDRSYHALDVPVLPQGEKLAEKNSLPVVDPTTGLPVQDEEAGRGLNKLYQNNGVTLKEDGFGGLGGFGGVGGGFAVGLSGRRAQPGEEQNTQTTDAGPSVRPPAGLPEENQLLASARPSDAIHSPQESVGRNKALGFDWYLGNVAHSGETASAPPASNNSSGPPPQPPAPPAGAFYSYALGGGLALGDSPQVGVLFDRDTKKLGVAASDPGQTKLGRIEDDGRSRALQETSVFAKAGVQTPAPESDLLQKRSGGTTDLSTPRTSVGKDVLNRGSLVAGVDLSLAQTEDQRVAQTYDNYFKTPATVATEKTDAEQIDGIVLPKLDGKTAQNSAEPRDVSRPMSNVEARQNATFLPAHRESVQQLESDVAVRKPSANAPVPQPEILTAENRFSTFSLNVSDVSFKLAAASLEQGQLPEAASIRSEEFINAFDYRDPEPPQGAPVAFAWERARDPFAHNRDLLRFSLKTAAAGRQAGRPLNLVLLLDNSGSMERADRVQIIRQALRVLASQLQPQDKLSVVTFARTARLVADGVSGDQAAGVTEQVSGLTPEGGTNLEDAMNLAYATAARHYLPNGINRVVLLTDGAANLGDVDPDSLKRKAEAQRKQGIALDCFGIGWEGYNDDLLEVLSRNGGGRYGFLNSPDEAARDFAAQLAGALKVAASDVKVQVEFNPNRVTLFRQIGYAKHQLAQEQFRDNTVLAAEIAAQEAGNALYTVQVNPAGAGPLGTVRVRYRIPGTTDYREQAWDVPFTGNAAALERSSAAMRLAAGAGAFAEWLAASPFAGDVTPDALLNCLRGVKETYGADERPQKLESMILQAKRIGGK